MATKNEMPEKLNEKLLGTLGIEVEINTFKTTGRLRKWWFHISDKKKKQFRLGFAPRANLLKLSHLRSKEKK